MWSACSHSTYASTKLAPVTVVVTWSGLWCSLTWNLLGMLSNTFFRIKMQPKANQEGQLCLYCEHPTKSGGEPGGWMERKAMANGGMAAVTEKQAVASTNVDTSKLKTFTLEEVRQPFVHNTCSP